MEFEIQRFNPKLSKSPDGWMLAYGLRGGRSWIRNSTEAEAVKAFHKKTARARTPMRLIERTSWGYRVGTTVVATNGIKAPKLKDQSRQ